MGNLFESNYSGAEFSLCGKYRYKLWRIWDESKPKAMCIGLNPSTANATKPDPTITNLIKMLKILGYGGFYMMNCYPLISSKPDALNDFIETPFHDVEDLENAKHLMETARLCEDIIFAWGTFPIVKEHGRDKMFSGYYPNALCFGHNQNGSPAHPLAMMYQGKTKSPKLIPFNPSPMGVTPRHDK